MTGPRLTTVHPQHRGGRHLLPFLAAFMLGPLACTSDQPTEAISQPPARVAAATGLHPRARITHTAKPQTSASFSIASSTISNGSSVLILADVNGAGTPALADTLSDAGFQVTVRPGPEYSWDGTNPPLAGFDVVVHLNGSSYDGTPGQAAQDALNSFVQNGGGYVGAQWNGVEFTPAMSDLILQGVGSSDGSGSNQNCAVCQVTYETEDGQGSHPLLSGLPASFTFTADGHDAGQQLVFDGTTVLMHVSSGGPAVLVREFGSGKVVNFSFAPNYPLDDAGMERDWAATPPMLENPYIKGLYVNAVLWAAGLASDDQAQPQTITFDALADKVFGNPAFTVSASASSGLPVSLDATGPCTILGSTVTITGVGTCTITAHQAGNALYLEAPDVARSFNIAKGPATITVGTEYTFDGTAKSATIVTNPAGLSGVTVSYTWNGSPIAEPINAGVYQVVATLDNPNYQAPAASGTLTINPASPSIHWTPASLSAGSALGPGQLNATATGIGGTTLSGGWTYNPSAGTVLAAGTATLSVQFAPSDPNYAPAASTVTITVVSALNFTGFFLPVRNLPYVNTVNAGSAIPMKFTVAGSRGSQVLKVGSPVSMTIQCSAGAPQNALYPVETNLNGLYSVGYNHTYVWRTNRSWAGTCRKFILTLVDGSTHEAVFYFMPAPRAQPVRRVVGHSSR